MSEFFNPYSVLGVSSDAPLSEVKKSYRKLSRKYHPDVNPDDPLAETRFASINKAYDMIQKGTYKPAGLTRVERPSGSFVHIGLFSFGFAPSA